MDAPNPERKIVTRTIRPGAGEPADRSWRDASIEERIEGVWTLTKLCLAWNSEDDDEPRLQRSVVRVLRRAR
ncbi:MAG: hypothetical protein H6831_04755 [Planctomycetes bacterium]|nr:hypothetical protein [Planctomycetota bacterium]MCB9903699.1 hypothetical protein [Planctomycetota bacterium]